ncbi:MAG: hypothetical protein B6D55_04735 [Candidatus Omnitrophica bacterium 4484_70.2]|nr:MAG: hypothetical protein B6D55_04735 [Candidatus Omnitrophica bacterium 4484_70.2]
MTWEYLYHFTKKSKKYYSDLDSVRIPIQTFENRPDGFTRCREYGYNSKYLQEYSPQPKQSGHRRTRASEEEIKRYKGKFNNLSPEEAEMFNSPRARNLRQQEAKKQGLHTFYTHSRRSLPNKVLDPRGNHNGGPGSWRDFKDEHPSFTHPLGKNLPTVWLINPEPHNFSKEFGANCDHFACVTSDTEILTDEGWKKYTEIKKCNNLLVATYNLKTKKIEYQELLYIKEYDYDGNLIHIGNRDLDILITPNHRNIVVKKNNEDKIVLAKDLVDRDKIRVWAPVDYKIEYSIGEIWAELVGWIISEGHYSKEYKLIEIYQNVGENEKKIDYLLNKGKIYYKKHIRERRYKGQIKKQVTWYISHCAFVDWVYKNVPDKKLNKLLVSLPQNELKALMKGLILGDGCIRKDGRVSFIQKDKKCIDWFEILAMRCGFHTITSKHKHNNVWIVYLTKRESIGIRNTNGKGKSIQEVYYKGKIWCPRTPNGTWVAKRNGRIFITGNTFPESLLVIPIKFSTPEERIVLDPFCGTGTVGVVAQKLGRKFIGIDLNKDYLTQIAIPRIEKERTLFPIL